MIHKTNVRYGLGDDPNVSVMVDYLGLRSGNVKLDGQFALTLYPVANMYYNKWKAEGWIKRIDTDYDEQADRQVYIIYLTQKGRDLVALELL